MSASSVPAVKAKIIDLLQARAGLATTQVTWASPTEKSDYAPQSIFFGETEQDEEWASLGALRRSEEYRLDLTIRVYQDGDDPKSVEQTAWTLRHELNEALRADPGLGGLVLQHAELASTRMMTSPSSPGGWVAEATCRIRCLTRI